MKWRKWPGEKPKEGVRVFIKGTEATGHDVGNLEYYYDSKECLWLDESDEAFEEVARERGYINAFEAEYKDHLGIWRPLVTDADRDSFLRSIKNNT